MRQMIKRTSSLSAKFADGDAYDSKPTEYGRGYPSPARREERADVPVRLTSLVNFFPYKVENSANGAAVCNSARLQRRCLPPAELP